LVNDLFERFRFEKVCHCAAILAHAATDKRRLWSGNVEGTRVVADQAARHGARSLVFISRNCLWGRGSAGRRVKTNRRRRSKFTAHRKPAPMGAIRLLKWVS
jgi:nucleoside-diphosphate-sugar epimerase